jgi:hypothetical protein
VTDERDKVMIFRRSDVTQPFANTNNSVTDPAVERCTGCNMTRVYCQAVSGMERAQCCESCDH